MAAINKAILSIGRGELSFLCLFLVFCFMPSFSSCRHDNAKQNSKGISFDEVAFELNSKKVYRHEIEKKLENDFYFLRLNSISDYVDEYVFKNYCVTIGKSEEQTLDSIKATINLGMSDLISFTANNPSYDLSSKESIMELKQILSSLSFQSKLNTLVDSLKFNTVNLNFYLTKPFSKLKSADDMSCRFVGKNNSKTEIIFVADYRCHSCKEKYQFFKTLIYKYSNYARFGFVYYREDLAADDPFLNSFVVDEDSILNLMDELFILKNFEVNLKYEKKKNNDFKGFLEKMNRNNKVLIENEVFEVPLFIVNGYMLPANTSYNSIEKELVISILSQKKN